MYCSNCFIEMTRVESVNRWYGPIASQWNKMLVLIGMVYFLFVYFLFGSINQENLELMFTPVARFGIKGTSSKILHTCPTCDYQNTTYLSYLRFHRLTILLENIWTLKSLKNVQKYDEQSLYWNTAKTARTWLHSAWE